jgi:hypothetical protein
VEGRLQPLVVARACRFEPKLSSDEKQQDSEASVTSIQCEFVTEYQNIKAITSVALYI